MLFQFIADVDADLFNRTKGAWGQQISDNPESSSVAYYESRLAYLERCVKGEVAVAEGAMKVCAVVQDGTDYAAALVTAIHAKGRASLRMLDVTVQPRLDLADREPNNAELAWIAAELITGCLGLTYEDFPSKELKIRTQFPLDHDFLTSISTVMMRDSEFSRQFEVKGHGMWLVVTKKDE